MGEPAAVGKGSGLKIQEYTHHIRPPSPAGADQGNCLRSGLTFRKGHNNLPGSFLQHARHHKVALFWDAGLH